MAVIGRAPTLSIGDLVGLFDDHPTTALVEAICDQICPRPVVDRDVFTAMFQLPRLANWPDDFELSEQERGIVHLGLEIWKHDHKET